MAGPVSKTHSYSWACSMVWISLIRYGSHTAEAYSRWDRINAVYSLRAVSGLQVVVHEINEFMTNVIDVYWPRKICCKVDVQIATSQSSAVKAQHQNWHRKLEEWWNVGISMKLTWSNICCHQELESWLRPTSIIIATHRWRMLLVYTPETIGRLEDCQPVTTVWDRLPR